MISPIPAACPELGKEVQVAAIELELRRLWEQDDARTNASLMNLVIYSEKPGALLENSAIIRNLTREHACRAILVEIDRRTPAPGLRAWITAHCHLAFGRKSVCCEQVAFHLTGKVTGRFRNTVFAHLNSDLPLVFWWQGELSDVFTERLVNVMDRLIIDSASWTNPAASFQHIAEAKHAMRDLVVQDLEWTRSWQLRVGIAGIFDDPIAQQTLPEISVVEIVHHENHRNSALQLLAWLATQAHWSEVNGMFGQLQSAAGRNIMVKLSAQSAGPPVHSVNLSAGSKSLRVAHASDPIHVERRIDFPDYHVASLSPVDPESAEELVALQLSRGGRNTLFRKILPRFLKYLNPPHAS